MSLEAGHPPGDDRVSSPGAPDGTPALPFASDLATRPWAYHFYRAMRMLEVAYGDLPRFGRALSPEQEPVRLGQDPSVGFRSAMIATFLPTTEATPARLDVNFFGLFGPEGPLPVHLTVLALRREQDHKDYTLRHFFNLFTHRMLGFFYRAWADAQPVAQADRPDDDRFAFFVEQLAGAGPLAATDVGILREVRLHWAGLFAMPSRPAEGLQRLLQGFLGAPVRVEPWCGRWHALADSELGRLGHASARLGTAVLGTQIWDAANHFRIVIGPLRLARFESLLPGGTSLRQLREIVRRWTGDELGWDLRLILRREEIPPLRLGQAGRLGWTTWMNSMPAVADAADCVLEPEPQAV